MNNGFTTAHFMLSTGVLQESFSSLLVTLESFGLCSGLRVNHGKTEMLALSSNNLEEKNLNDHKICDSIKIWGVYIGYDGKQRNDLNYQQTLKSIKKLMHTWKWRNLPYLFSYKLSDFYTNPH